MSFNAYLSFNGNCAEAFAFYETTLGGRIEAMLTHRETPASEQTPAEWQDKIIHACMTLNGTMIMGGDVPPQMYQPMTGFSVNVVMPTATEAERVFAALSTGGTVQMPMEETFWAERFGMATDRFGVPWMVNCFKPNPDGENCQ
ncbi:VOC family protein [Ferrovibrio sp.]|uniref:VOC family protein n=1 Tax=Ferrovibrio sp. TaxID=1917215 RepID=UPI002625CE2B|nr:VOC family protein [Ferrovibrio sp.]